MKKEIIINATSSEIRVAITEDDRLAEIFLEVPDKERHVGSIYLGRVERVVQGMNAAFIDIGEPQDAFLHFSDVGSALDEFKDLLDDKDEEDDDEEDEPPTKKDDAGNSRGDGRGKKDAESKETAAAGNGRSRDGRTKKDDRRKQDRRSSEREKSAPDEQPATTAPEETTAPPRNREERDRGHDGRRRDDRRRDDRRRNDRRPRAEAQAEPERKQQEPAGDDEPEHRLPVAETAGHRTEHIIAEQEPETGTAEETEDVADELGERKRRRKRGRRGGRGRNRRRTEEEAAAEGSQTGEGTEQEMTEDEPSEQKPAGTAQEREPRRPASNRRGDEEAGEPAATDETSEPSRIKRDDRRGQRDRRRSGKRDGRRHDDTAQVSEPHEEMPEKPATGEPAQEPAAMSGDRRSSVGEKAEPAAESDENTADTKTTRAKRAPRKSGARRSRPASATTSGAPEAAEAAGAAEPAASRDAADTKSKAAGKEPEAMKEGATKRGRGSRGGRRRRDDDDTPVKGSSVDAKLPTFQTKRSGEVTIALEKGQDVIVQVTRESYASKGVRVTTKVSLPGRFLVLLPLDPAIGISRKVQNMKERRRLRRIAKSILPEGHGCIIRTVAQDKDEDVIRQDLTKLIETWRDIEQKIKQTDKPGLLYKDQSIANTVMRDLFTPDTNRVVIDNKTLYKEIRDYVEWAAPALVKKVELYTGSRPIFDHFGTEKELQKVAERKVYIPSGGYIILDQTEAMMVIDVNSGRYAGKKDQELNSLRTNLESAREIARQIRLRDIGGLIVVDFIDLYDEKNRKKVYDEMKKEMKKDRAKSVVLPMTQFGLVQMTRQRIRQQVVQTISEPCPVCSGSGLVQSRSTVVRNIERWLQRFRESSREFRLILTANPIIIDYLTEGEEGRLTKMMLKYFVRIKIIPDDSLSMDEFQFSSIRTGTDITARFLQEASNGSRKREKEKEKNGENRGRDSRKAREMAA